MIGTEIFRNTDAGCEKKVEKLEALQIEAYDYEILKQSDPPIFPKLGTFRLYGIIFLLRPFREAMNVTHWTAGGG